MVPPMLLVNELIVPVEVFSIPYEMLPVIRPLLLSVVIVPVLIVPVLMMP